MKPTPDAGRRRRARLILRVATVLLLANGAWMTFDGARALLVGDYVTPRSGDYAGQLGPWAGLLARVGLPPRSTPVKAAFVVLGLVTIAASVLLLRSVTGARRLVAAAAVLDAWYLPFGTISAVFLLGSLIATRRSSPP